MAVQTRTNLKADQATNLADNASGDISAADLRTEFEDLTDSALLREDIDTIAELNTIVADATIVVQGGALGTPSGGNASNLTNFPATLMDTTSAQAVTAGIKKTFQADATNAGLRLAGVTANPSTLVAGDVWFRSDSNKILYRGSTSVRTVVAEALAQNISNKTHDSVHFIERADHVNTFPTAARAELWVSNDATQKLKFTDDAGTDKEVAFVTGGADLAAYTGVLGLNSGTAVDVDTQAKLETRVPDLRTVTVNAQTGTTYTLVLTDAAKFVTLGNATSNAVTIPTNASVAFAVGTVIAFQLIGAGTGTIEGDTGVTLNGVSAGSGTLSAQWAGASIIKTDTNTWSVIGDIGTVA